MGEIINGIISNLVASMVAIFTVKMMVKNDRKSDVQDMIAHAEKHAVIEQRLDDHSNKIAAVEGDVYTELKEIRAFIESRFDSSNQLIMQLIKEKQ